jgi:hypothetical protein
LTHEVTCWVVLAMGLLTDLPIRQVFKHARRLRPGEATPVGHFVLRALMTQAAVRVRIDPDRLSFAGCLQLLRCRLPECDSRSSRTLVQWYALLLAEMAEERIEPRRNRINPRVIKRKMSKWPKKRAEHRRPPPLQKTFEQSVVMIR